MRFFDAPFSWKVIKGNEVKCPEVNGLSCLGCKTQSDSSDSKIDTKETTGHQNSTTQKIILRAVEITHSDALKKAAFPQLQQDFLDKRLKT